MKDLKRQNEIYFPGLVLLLGPSPPPSLFWSQVPGESSPAESFTSCLGTRFSPLTSLTQDQGSGPDLGFRPQVTSGIPSLLLKKS